MVFFFAYKKLAQFAGRCALPPRRSESPVCATDNKPSCALHLLGWFIGSRVFFLLGTKARILGLTRQSVDSPSQEPIANGWRPPLFCFSWPPAPWLGLKGHDKEGYSLYTLSEIYNLSLKLF